MLGDLLGNCAIVGKYVPCAWNLDKLTTNLKSILKNSKINLLKTSIICTRNNFNTQEPDIQFHILILTSPTLNPFSAKERRRAALACCEKCQRRDSATFDSSLLALKNCQDEIHDDVWYAAVRTEMQ
ncbi:hypothetical protein RF11_07868 [Thelohanellus kitauei]|uniref:Uncharacterized protein n=1 Tax=Thelohanellus kitauei TaxID=669202 RepID=A0A0C2ICX7_THEKT|nr:hypothetical protein RF11_07868 [Thelohanellus kitauei]